MKFLHVLGKIELMISRLSDQLNAKCLDMY